MIEPVENRYTPNYAVHPGKVMDEYLKSYGMTQKELADRTGLTPKTVNEIVQGKAPITPQTALRLERVFGRPAHFWSSLEREYQQARARIESQQQLQRNQKWLKRLPIKEMVRYGWIPKCANAIDQLEEVLRFFGVASPDQWRAVWETHQVAYRQSRRFQVHAEAVSAWLRRGELQAQGMLCASYNRQRFLKALQEARGLTCAPPEVFQPRLTEICAAAGVAVAFVPELPRTRLWGATRWLTPDRALIQLSLRYKTDDHLWFTFFHEAAHVLLHGKKEVFLEGGAIADQKETAADRFASDFLIPPSELRTFMSRGDLTLSAIADFACHIGIAPGIVIGRLQHEGIVGRDIGNRLKRSFRWVIIDPHNASTERQDTHGKEP